MLPYFPYHEHMKNNGAPVGEHAQPAPKTGPNVARFMSKKDHSQTTNEDNQVNDNEDYCVS